MTDALLLGLGADAHAFLAKVRARHDRAAGRENRTKEAAIASLARMKAEAETEKKSRRFRRLEV